MDQKVADYCAVYKFLVDYDATTDTYRIGRRRVPYLNRIAGILLHGANEALVYAAGYTAGEYDEHERCQRLLEEAQPR